MNKRKVMKVENLVRNYKMVHSDRQDEEEIKVGQDEPLFKVTLNKPIPKKELLSSATLAFGEDLYNSHQKGFTEVRELGGCSEFGVFPNFYDGSNERLMPTGEELKDKNFMVGLWGYIQSKSKCNHMDEFRYVAKKDISPTKIAEHITNFLKENGGDIYINKPVTRPTINKGIKYLKDNCSLIKPFALTSVKKTIVTTTNA